MVIKILTVLLLILKILGIVLLVLLGILLALLLIVLFVPVRYQGSGYREEGDPVPVHVQLKVTWLLHLVRVSFIYPEEAFLKVKVLFFQILPAKEKKKKASNKKEADGKKPKTDKKEAGHDVRDTASDQKISDEGNTAVEDGGDDRRTLLDFVRKLFPLSEILSTQSGRYMIR